MQYFFPLQRGQNLSEGDFQEKRGGDNTLYISAAQIICSVTLGPCPSRSSSQTFESVVTIFIFPGFFFPEMAVVTIFLRSHATVLNSSGRTVHMNYKTSHVHTYIN